MKCDLLPRSHSWKPPKLIITEQDGDTPMLGMCSACRALLPAIKANGRDSNSRLLETVFGVHVKAEHSDQAPSWEAGQGK